MEAYIRAGRPDEARARLDEVETHVHMDEPLGAYTRCRALMADADECDDLFAESLRLFDRLGDVFEGARTRLCYGERLRRANRRRDARLQLADALDAFEQLRAASWADRTRRELRASGEHRRRRDHEARDELTPQERQIATLAAEGRTNREIVLCFLSTRARSRLISDGCSKLGITDRRALTTKDSSGQLSEAREDGYDLSVLRLHCGHRDGAPYSLAEADAEYTLALIAEDDVVSACRVPLTPVGPWPTRKAPPATIWRDPRPDDRRDRSLSAVRSTCAVGVTD